MRLKFLLFAICLSLLGPILAKGTGNPVSCESVGLVIKNNRDTPIEVRGKYETGENFPEVGGLVISGHDYSFINFYYYGHCHEQMQDLTISDYSGLHRIIRKGPAKPGVIEVSPHNSHP